MQLRFNKITNGLFKLIHWPLCRAYARHIIGDNPADSVMRFLCGFQYLRVYGRWPDFMNPQSFSEKLWSRMLHERDPLLTLISDKFRVRDYVASRIGADHLIPLLWHGEKPEEIPFDELPEQFVIKTNHGCGYNIIVTDKENIDRMQIINQLEKWLSENFCQDKYIGIGWGYKNIAPHILVELFIGEKDKPPIDFKFYCFSGQVEIATLHFDRYENHSAKAFHRDFSPFIFRPDFKQHSGEIKKPHNFEKMVSLTEALAVDFDFMRIDLYKQGDNIYFGEMTPYPAGVSGFRGFDIYKLDNVLGEKWGQRENLIA